MRHGIKVPRLAQALTSPPLRGYSLVLHHDRLLESIRITSGTLKPLILDKLLMTHT